MRAADEYTIQEIGIPSLVLMERAALETVKIIEQRISYSERILVVCGSGNNGGDGYAIARLLYLKGYKVDICFVGNDNSRSLENREQKRICDYYQIPVVKDLKEKEYNVIVDAIFGVGLSREISGSYYDVINILNRMKGLKIAVDIPSGLNDATGGVMGIVFRADITVAIAYIKQGEVLQPGNESVGELVIADIGIYDDALSKEESISFTYELEDLSKHYPKRTANSHKGTYGKVSIIAGSKGMSGAAYLSAKAAYAAGAGLVQIYTHEENRVILQKLLPEVIVTTYDSFEEEQLKRVCDWADVVGIGCGLGQSTLSDAILTYVLKYAECPCVIDADGLNLLANHMELLEGRTKPTILTPHMKEMTRLLACEMNNLQENRMDLLKQFIAKYPVTCVLKDARTLVLKKEENLYINTSGNAAMAKGGSGDVLTGIISGILAQGLGEYEAATLGVYLHGLAGDAAREKLGSYSVLASDIIEAIGDILKQM